MPNGILTTRPVARYGDNWGNLGSGFIMTQEFQCPGSGIKNINELGVWVATFSGNNAFRLSIWTHDPDNNCPEEMLAETATLYATSDDPGAAVYGSVDCQVTGGDYYWIAIFWGDSLYVSYLASGGTSIYVSGYTPYTWPTSTQWHTHTDNESDCSLWAIYSDAPPVGGRRILII